MRHTGILGLTLAMIAMTGASARADTPPDVQRVSDVVTVQTGAPHGLLAGDTVTVAGVTHPPNPCGDAIVGTSFNGTFTVAAAPSATSFSYAQSGPDEIGQGGSATGPVITKGISTVSRSSSIVTVNTSGTHGFSNGQTVTIAGVVNAAFNGTFTISSVPTSTTFTYAQAGANDASTSGTATVTGTTKSIGSGDTTGPSSPGALSATGVMSSDGGVAQDNDGTFGVQWGASSDAGSGVDVYCVQRSTGASGTFDFRAFVGHPATSVAESGLGEGSYSYRVRTRDKTGNLSSFTSPFQVVVAFPASSSPQALSVSRAGDGSGAVTSSPAGIDCGAACSTQFTQGTVVTLVPTAANGSRFAGWGGACSGTAGCQVTMTEARAVIATFSRVSGTPVAPDTVAPRVTLPKQRLRATRQGSISLSIVCPGAEPDPCKGKVTLQNPGTRTVAKAAFTISPGTTKRLRMRLSRNARRVIARKGRLSVRAVVVATDPAGNARTTRVRLTIR